MCHDPSFFSIFLHGQKNKKQKSPQITVFLNVPSCYSTMCCVCHDPSVFFLFFYLNRKAKSKKSLLTVVFSNVSSCLCTTSDTHRQSCPEWSAPSLPSVPAPPSAWSGVRRGGRPPCSLGPAGRGGAWVLLLPGWGAAACRHSPGTHWSTLLPTFCRKGKHVSNSMQKSTL